MRIERRFGKFPKFLIIKNWTMIALYENYMLNLRYLNALKDPL